jgi:hypothetical protein
MMRNSEFFKASPGTEYGGFDVITHKFIIIAVTYAASALIAWGIQLPGI